MTDNDSAWHLDKRVPIALIFTMLLQGAVGIWWLAALSSRVDHLEAQAPLRDEVVGMRVQIDNIQRTLARFEAFLDSRQPLKDDRQDMQ